MGMMVNLVYNQGCSAKIFINVRNKTLIQGKLANRGWPRGGSEDQEPVRVQKGCWWTWLEKRWRGTEPELLAVLCQTAGLLTARALFSLSPPPGHGGGCPEHWQVLGKGKQCWGGRRGLELFLACWQSTYDSWGSWIRQAVTSHGTESCSPTPSFWMEPLRGSNGQREQMDSVIAGPFGF